jgi:hypothetical protein
VAFALIDTEDARGLWLTRLLLGRGLGLVCLIAFVVALNQFRPLLGEHGLLPVPLFVKYVPFRQSPSLFYLWPRDRAFAGAAWLGILLSVIAVLGITQRRTSTGARWKRTFTADYFPPVSLADPDFRQALRDQGWDEGDALTR